MHQTCVRRGCRRAAATGSWFAQRYVEDRLQCLRSRRIGRIDQFGVPGLEDLQPDRVTCIIELAEVAGYHPAYFARLLKQQTGLSPRTWLVDRRIRFAARRLMETHLDIQTVAYECGYENPFFFSRQLLLRRQLPSRHLSKLIAPNGRRKRGGRKRRLSAETTTAQKGKEEVADGQ